MIDEKYLKMAIQIRRTYLKLDNNMDLYRSKLVLVQENLEKALNKVEKMQGDIKTHEKEKKTEFNEKEILENINKVIDDIEDEGKKLEKMIDPINVEIERLAKEEQELYRQIVDRHPELSEDQIVKIVTDRLIKEGLSK